MTAQKKEIVVTNLNPIEPAFSKDQILASKRFQGKKDIVNALLLKFPDTATFTVKAVEEMIENYMKGQVK